MDGNISRVPAKIILFGEYCVLSGGVGISFAIKRYGYVKYTNEEDVILIEKKSQKFNLTNQLENYKAVQIDLDFELGSCLGSSAVMSLLLASTKYKKPEKILDEALRLENNFHGKSSGIDVYTCFMGGILSYTLNNPVRLTTNLQNFKVLIWYSNIRKSTKNSIEVVDKSIFSKLGEISRSALNLLSKDFTLKELYVLIREAQELLEEMGVCPEPMKNMVKEVRKRGIEAKITGSGNGGYLITVVDPNVQIEGWSEAQIDFEGFKLFYDS